MVKFTIKHFQKMFIVKLFADLVYIKNVFFFFMWPKRSISVITFFFIWMWLQRMQRKTNAILRTHLLVIRLHAIIAKTFFLCHFFENKKLQSERTCDRTHFYKLQFSRNKSVCERKLKQTYGAPFLAVEPKRISFYGNFNSFPFVSASKIICSKSFFFIGPYYEL